MNSVRGTLEQYGIHPSRKLGQSFLEDMNMVRRIVALAELSSDDTVVEIGSGLGFLTEAIAREAGRVIAIEIDHRLIEILREKFSDTANVEIVGGDVLAYDFSTPLPEGKIKIIGNVPYSISTPIVFHLLHFRRWISSMVLMFQKELADRFVASPGTKDYGIPSVILGRYAVSSLALKVPPTCFYPEPAVVSSVVRMVMRERPSMELPNEALFSRLVKKSFSQRRKTLWNNLRREELPEEVLNEVFAKADIDSSRRAETLSVEEFGKLTFIWGTMGSGE